MAQLFTAEYQWLWTSALGLALFVPVRQLIWALSVRRAQRKSGVGVVDEVEQLRLKRRAGLTAGLLCVVFSIAYVDSLFRP